MGEMLSLDKVIERERLESKRARRKAILAGYGRGGADAGALELLADAMVEFNAQLGRLADSLVAMREFSVQVSRLVDRLEP